MNLNTFFSPRSIAVIGVSRHATKLGSRVFLNLRNAGFRGRVIPINPTLKRFAGQRVYPTILHAPGTIDCAVIVTPAETVPQILVACGRKGIRNCVVISAGFREIGGEGEKRESALCAIAQRYRMRLLGPNCLGFLHAGNRVNASFGAPIVGNGNVVLISQSGAMAVAIADWARLAGVRIGAIVSLGNKAGLTEVEMLEHFGRDPKTDVIVCYLESCERGEEFCTIARRVTRTKPIIVLKAGESDLGRRAARSHTGALATNRAVFAAAMHSAGIIHVDRIEDLFDSAHLFSRRQRMHGNGCVLLTNAGGPGIMATDAVAAAKTLTLARLLPKTQGALRAHLPQAASVANPVDIVGDADAQRYKRALDALAHDPGVGSVVVILTQQVVTQSIATARVVAAFARRNPHIAVVASFLGGIGVRAAQKILSEEGVPHFMFPEDAVSALDRLAQASIVRLPSKLPISLKKKNTRPLQSPVLPPDAVRLLRRYGFSCVQQTFQQSPRDVLRDARRLGYPLVLKRMHPRVIHKAASGAVWAPCASRAELVRALREGERRFGRVKIMGDGWLLQRYVQHRAEWFLGGKRDQSFGPVIICGRGGTGVEGERAIHTFVPPFQAHAFRDALRECAAGSVLHAASDFSSILKAAHNCARLLHDHREIRELDCNPLLVGPRGRGAIVVDVRIIVAPS